MSQLLGLRINIKGRFLDSNQTYALTPFLLESIKTSNPSLYLLRHLERGKGSSDMQSRNLAHGEMDHIIVGKMYYRDYYN